MDKINILVIDDDPAVLSWFKVLNTPTSPYLFQTLQNEMNAASAIERFKPQMVFLDISLNTLDGPIIASILNGHNIDDSKIVAISSDAKNKKATQAAHFLQKPLTKEMVLEKVKEVLKA